MKRINKKLLLITALVVLLPLLVGLLLWNRLPDVMTTHWNAAGEADGTSGKGFAVFFTPLFLLFMHLICVGATALDTGNENQSKKALYIAYWAMPLVSLYAGVMIYGTTFQVTIDPVQAMSFLLGLLFVFIGNYMPKMQPNHTLGIRIPQTLKDADNWRKTHRLAGKVWFAGGIALIVLPFFLKGGALFIAFAVILTVLIAVPLVYSFRLSRKKQ